MKLSEALRSAPYQTSITFLSLPVGASVISWFIQHYILTVSNERIQIHIRFEIFCLQALTESNFSAVVSMQTNVALHF